jgi:hypothetical protein
VSSDRISDHFTVIATLDVPVLTQNDRKTTIKWRNIKSIDIEAFKDDVLKSKLIADPCNNAEDLAKQYDNTLASILDRHAPLATKVVIPKKNNNPWMTPEILAAKNRRRYLERVWRRNPTPLNRTRHIYSADTLMQLDDVKGEIKLLLRNH